MICLWSLNLSDRISSCLRVSVTDHGWFAIIFYLFFYSGVWIQHSPKIARNFLKKCKNLLKEHAVYRLFPGRDITDCYTFCECNYNLLRTCRNIFSVNKSLQKGIPGPEFRAEVYWDSNPAACYRERAQVGSVYFHVGEQSSTVWWGWGAYQFRSHPLWV